MIFFSKKSQLPTAEQALPGRAQGVCLPQNHWVTANPIMPPFPPSLEQAIFGMGCFWGAERKFWQQPGVFTTAVGYAGGFTPNPTYEEVCSGLTGHCEVVLVVFDPLQIAYTDLLALFWQSHNPTQGMRQGNDQGTQYRSAIYACNDEQLNQALQSRQVYQTQLHQAGFGDITTEIKPSPVFYYAENSHQQYLAIHSNGYCGLGGLGIEWSDCANQ